MPLETQEFAFYEQVKIAIRHNLPLVLHIRNAEEQALKVLTKMGLSPYNHIHRPCFTGDIYTLCKWLNFFHASKIGFTNLVTYQGAREIPLNNYLLFL